MTKVSKILNSKIELLDFLCYLNYLNLPYQSNLGFPKDLTYGLEIEYTKALYEEVKKTILKPSSPFKYSPDSTVIKETSLGLRGGELISPVLCDCKKDWLLIKQTLIKLRNLSAGINDSCALHIHVGSQIFQDNYSRWEQFLKLWAIYEPIFYYFAKGSANKIRDLALKYAKPCRENIINNLKVDRSSKDIYSLIKCCTFRHASLYCGKVKDFTYQEGNTIEFRLFNGTLDEKIIQNNCRFLFNFLTKISNYTFSTEEVGQLYDKIFTTFSNYFQADFYSSFSYADLFFDRDNDKYYFLKQYFNLFEAPLDKIKELVRKSR